MLQGKTFIKKNSRPEKIVYTGHQQLQIATPVSNNTPSSLDVRKPSDWTEITVQTSFQLPELGAAFAIDHIYSNMDGDLVIEGWCVEDPADPCAFLVIDEDCRTFDLRPFIKLRPRKDVYDELLKNGFSMKSDLLGFIALVEAGGPLRDPHVVCVVGSKPYWLTPVRETRLLAENDDGALKLIRLAAHTRDTGVLAALSPVIERLRSNKEKRDGEPQALSYGPPPPNPAVSIVIPLYARIDFMEHQLLHFAGDPDLRNADIIFVLDDPRLSEQLQNRARFWYALYGLSFRVVFLKSNLGYSGANNVGAAFARAPKLLLLNSDVFPDAPGWLSRLAAALDAQPNAGVVSPRLLFPDGSIQYEGINFRLSERLCPFYLNDHPGRGFPPGPFGAPFEVAAATGACLMMPTALYRSLDGLDEGFLIGDFEDSDLSLKVRAAGYTVWCVPEIFLWHLERQSMVSIHDASVRQFITYFNAWRHHLRWSADIDGYLNSF